MMLRRFNPSARAAPIGLALLLALTMMVVSSVRATPDNVVKRNVADGVSALSAGAVAGMVNTAALVASGAQLIQNSGLFAAEVASQSVQGSSLFASLAAPLATSDATTCSGVTISTLGGRRYYSVDTRQAHRDEVGRRLFND
jgi:hypothetical protein